MILLFISAFMVLKCSYKLSTCILGISNCFISLAIESGQNEEWIHDIGVESIKFSKSIMNYFNCILISCNYSKITKIVKIILISSIILFIKYPNENEIGMV
jgi:hypothetical protein